MNIQVYQFLNLLAYFILLLAFWQVKGFKLKVGILLLMLVVFTVSPMRHKASSGAALEGNSFSKFDNIPDRVDVEREDFGVRQEEGLNELEEQSRQAREFLVGD